jgi:hypothetical protein
VKRQCILELPPHLIVHLKRFEFDLDTLRKKKLNDFCAIPTTLNLKHLTKEYLAAKEAAEARAVSPPLNCDPQCACQWSAPFHCALLLRP